MTLPHDFIDVVHVADHQNQDVEKRERRKRGHSRAWIGIAADEQHELWTACP